jgi:hypothetical protein
VTESPALSLLLELFTWVGLGAGLLCFVMWLAVKWGGGTWVETTAVMPEPGDPQVRWMTEDGTLHSQQLDDGELADFAADGAATIYYSRRHPHRMRLHARGHGESLWRFLTAIFIGLGALSAVGSLVLLLVP